MAQLSPSAASNLANDIYLIQSEHSRSDFYNLHKSILLADEKNITKAEVGSRLINARDSFGICCAGANQFQDDLFLVFRGSTGANLGADWVSNARIGLEIGESSRPVHIGFNHIFQSMKKQIADQVASHKKPQVIHCVGHSLGGAIATLAADWASKEKLASDSVKVYTFGAPRPATHLFSKHFTDKLGKQNIFRVYHEGDPVPMIPVFPFCHAPFGNMGYFIHTRPFFWPWDHKMGEYIKSINAKGKSWQSLSPTGIHEPTEAQMQQWLESNIKVEPKAVSTWQWINSALFFVLRKVIGFSIAKLQMAFTGVVTLADSIAMLLKEALGNDSDNSGGPSGPSPAGTARRERRQARESVSVSRGVGYWVECLMRKIMQIIGWKTAVDRESLTRRFMQQALQKLIEMANFEATRAVQGLNA